MTFRITTMLICLTLTFGMVGCGDQGTVEFPDEKLDKAPDESEMTPDFKAPAVSEDPSKG